MIQLDSTTGVQFGVHLQGYVSGDVDFTLTNQLIGKVTNATITPDSTSGRATKFTYQPTSLIEGMYLLKFSQGGTTLAERLCYISDGATPLSESTYTAYTTGDNNAYNVYTVE